MYVLKFFLVLCFFFSLVSCKKGIEDCSTSYDKRCYKLMDEAYKKGVAIGVCYDPPEDKTYYAEDAPRLDPDHEACNALIEEASAKCEALPDDPDSIVVTSGSTFYKGGKKVCD